MATRYCDFNSKSGTLQGTWSISAGGTKWTGSGGNATSVLAVGDYIGDDSNTNREMWFRVTAINNDNDVDVAETADKAYTGVTLAYNDKNGQSIANAFCHPEQWRRTDVQAAGDVLWVRGGQVWKFGETQMNWFEANGTPSSPIEMKCDTDGSIFNDSPAPGRSQFRWDLARFTCMSITEDYIVFKGFKIGPSYGSGDTRMRWLSLDGAQGTIIEDCDFDAGGESGDGEYVHTNTSSNWVIFRDCWFHGNSDTAWRPFVAFGNTGRGLSGVVWLFERCYFTNTRGTFDGDSGGAIVHMNQCSFGYDRNGTGGTNNDVDDMINGDGMTYFLRNPYINLVSGGNLTSGVQGKNNGAIFIEDYNRTVRDNRQEHGQGVITTEQSPLRAGGADRVMKLDPNGDCGTIRPLILQDYPFELAVKLDKSVQKTISLWARASAWTAVPNAGEFFLEVEYYDSATPLTRTSVKSSQSFGANDTWTEFSVTITPAEDGLAYCRAKLAKDESGAVVYVDPIPVVS